MDNSKAIDMVNKVITNALSQFKGDENSIITFSFNFEVNNGVIGNTSIETNSVTRFKLN